MKTFRNIMLCILILTFTAVILGCTVYNYKMGPVSSSEELIEVEIPSGSSVKQIGSILEEKGLIRDQDFFYLYTRLFHVNQLQASTYQLSPNMGVKKIVEVLQNGNSYNPNVVTITFPEGISVTRMAEMIAASTNHTKEEVLEKVNDPTYLNSLLETYWFLTDEILDDDIYYKLEGYLFPNTYQFLNKDVSIEEIFAKMLNETDRILSSYREEIEASGYTVHEILTIASMVELEGVNDETRSGVASVFYNRLKANMSLGSDVTTYYAFQVDMADRDLTREEFNTANPYNTRGPGMEGKLPIGPICNPGEESIVASIEPEESSYLYFVADKYKNVYFTENYTEHQQVIQEIKDRGDWIAW